jgi:hypothetical protein
MESSGNGTGDRGLLFVICEAFSSVVGATALGDLENDRRFDIPRMCKFSFYSGAGNYLRTRRTEQPRALRLQSRKM